MFSDNEVGKISILILIKGTNKPLEMILVYIRNFMSTAKEGATFRFIYCESLGFFCPQIFEVLPVHVHQNFDAEA